MAAATIIHDGNTESTVAPAKFPTLGARAQGKSKATQAVHIALAMHGGDRGVGREGVRPCYSHRAKKDGTDPATARV